MRVASNQVVTVGFRVKGTSGTLVTADALPLGTLYLNGVATAIAVTVSAVSGVGKYKASWTNGVYSAGDQLQLEITAVVNGVVYAAMVWEATVDAVPSTLADITTARDSILSQGNSAWITASGFSTHSAADVASAVLVTPANKLQTSASGTVTLGQAFPANFAALGINSSGHLSRVTLVDTTTANTDMRGTDGAALAGSAMTLTSAERTALATSVEAALLNDGDGQALIEAIINRIETDLDLTDLSVVAIATAVRDAILDRLLAGNHDAPGSVGRFLQDVHGDAAAINARATEARLAKLDRDLASVGDVTSARDNVIAQGNTAWLTASGFSTHSAADVAAALLVTPSNKLQTDPTGNVSINQMFPANFAALGINASGHVNRVTLVDTTTANSDMRGTDGANTVSPPSTEDLRDAVLNRVLAGNHEIAGSLGDAIPEMLTQLQAVIKSGESRTIARAGKDPITFTETRGS